MAKITASKLFKTYASKTGPVEALRDIDLEIQDREFIVLVGPSGCGKSTLLRMFNALLRPTGGTLLFDGHPLTSPPASVGVVFQDAVLLPWRSAIDNVLLPAEILRSERNSALARAKNLLARVGLQDFEDRFPRELSGGMQQRVAICRALVHDPSLVLMDEPFAALDQQTRIFLGAEVRDIWRRSHQTVLFVTHDISEAILLSQQVWVMSYRPGRIIDVIDVDLPDERDPSIVSSPRFNELHNRVWTSLQAESMRGFRQEEGAA